MFSDTCCLVCSCGTPAKFLPLLFPPSPPNSEVLLLPLGFTIFLSRSCASKVTLHHAYFLILFFSCMCLRPFHVWSTRKCLHFLNKVIALINYFIGHIIQCVGSNSLTRGQICNHRTSREVLETPSFCILIFFRLRVHSSFW